MKQKPDVEFDNLRLVCPECGETLKTDICHNCGCEIDIEEFTVDIQPKEILT